MGVNGVAVKKSVEGRSREIVFAGKRDAGENVLRPLTNVEEKAEKGDHDM